MKRLPISGVSLLGVVALLAVLPAAAATSPLTGTWHVTQSIALPRLATGILDTAAGLSFVDLMHLDTDMEVRDLSGLFHANACGTVCAKGDGLQLKVPFSASTGIGDWTAHWDMSVTITYVHFLYDGAGKALGYVWIRRDGTALFASDEVTPGWNEGDPWPAPANKDDAIFVGWEGLTTMKFFDLKGNPLVLPFVDGESGFSELSGPFRALRVTGEPAR